MSRNISGCVLAGEMLLATSRGDRDAAKPPMMHRTASTTKYPAQTVSPAKLRHPALYGHFKVIKPKLLSRP